MIRFKFCDSENGDISEKGGLWGQDHVQNGDVFKVVDGDDWPSVQWGEEGVFSGFVFNGEAEVVGGADDDILGVASPEFNDSCFGSVADAGTANVRRGAAEGNLKWSEIDDFGVDVNHLAWNLIWNFVEFNASRFVWIGFEMTGDANFFRGLHRGIFVANDDLHRTAILTSLNQDVAKEKRGIGARVILEKGVLVRRKADKSDTPRFVREPSVEPAQVRFVLDVRKNVDLRVEVGAVL